VGHVGEEGAERDDHLDLELFGDADDLGTERAPLQLRLDAEEHHGVALGAGQGRRHHLVGRPGDLAGDAVHQAHLRAGRREVVEVLGVERGERAPAPALGEVAGGGRGCVGGVVPALERGHEHGPAQRGVVLPEHVVHGTTVPPSGP
jgi:hypothetical protein